MTTGKLKDGYGTVQKDIMQSEISIHAKAVYSLLVTYAGNKIYCHPSVNTICKDLRTSKTTIIKSIKELEDNKFLIIFKRKDENGLYSSNVYQPLHIFESLEEIKDMEKVVQEMDYPSLSDVLGVVQDMDPKIKHSFKIKKEIIIKDFEERFWNIYPNKVARGKCEEKWEKLKESDKQKIFETLPAFAKHKPFASYIHPNPTTYLNQERWKDELPTVDAVPKQIYKGAPAQEVSEQVHVPYHNRIDHSNRV